MPDARPFALFISDLHLQPSHPRTLAAFFAFLEQRAMAAQELYLLGDVFEYWAGDDDLSAPFHQQVTAALRRVSDAGVRLYWIAGNRDFLVGPGFAEASGATLLSEPHVASIGGQRIVLLHGDAECTDDVKYMAFRAMVRQPAWQAQFLALPLAQRQSIIAGLRQNSRQEQGDKSYAIMDVTPQAIAQVFAQTATSVMIHGHTHRPALHSAGATRRYVLPDWECDTDAARGGWIAVDAGGAITRHGLDGAILA
ncbi:UDP-2,3-diacylglucosamine diphosphatase [Janthinobacterium fluminis]|uniref:UDP-2,3-diacylglucosamine hydrolase n=1 Tax=Janthinobacterium fluminis TaxID=2987524 RepID=A0ABT5K030_9BURK|nr:UDP-2,3-diacylglucosamine diphosphatase [Janthinobacterium fluminis]MDC8758326.1 UDP-2,3-diacylglucosamine diphosphatase [Janthinobacterium fluminis]